MSLSRDVSVGTRVRATRDVSIGGVVDGGIVEAGGDVVDSIEARLTR